MLTADSRLALAVAVAALAACGPPPHGAQPDAAEPDAAEPDAAAAPDPVALFAAMPGACSVDHWCWQRPTPRGARLTSVFATASDNLWLVGETGYVVQWNGAAWREHVLPPPPFPASMNFGAVAGRSATDIWVLGGNLVYHWDGATWALRDFIPNEVDQEFHGIWEAPNGDVWVTMEYGVVRRSNGIGPFATIDVPPAQAPLSALGSIWGTSTDDLWISGRPGRMFHWDGSAFSEYSTGTYKSGGSLSGASANDAWVGGYDGTLVHWNGASWTPVETGLGNGYYIKGISVRAADDVWWIAQAGSFAAAILHWDGTALIKTTIYSELVITDLEIVAGRWWITADHGVVYVKQSVAAPIVPVVEPTWEPFQALWGTGDRDLYAVGPGLISHWDGDTWQSAPVSDVQSRVAISGVRTGGADEVWAVGSSLSPDHTHYQGDVFHGGGATWSKARIDETHPLGGVWASGPGEAIAVGDGGVVWRHAGGAWSQLASPTTANLRGVWGPDPDHAVIVGDGGTILRWDRSSPDVVVPDASGTAEDLRAVTSAGGITWIASTSLGPDNQVAVFESSATGWIRHPIPRSLGGYAIHATTATDVIVTGALGRVFRWNGGAFVEESSLFGGTLYAAFRPPMGSEWLAGHQALLKRVPP